MSGKNRPYQGRIEPNLTGIGLGSSDRQTARRQAIQAHVVQIRMIIRRLQLAQAKLLDCLDDPIPLKEACEFVNSLTIAGLIGPMDTNAGELAKLLTDDFEGGAK